jgi:microcystin-dependent protein
MASPPFNINQALPGDNDIVSQHPSNARTFRDVVESWLLINHNNLGQHSQLDMPYSAAPSTPGASLLKVYADVTGRVKVIYPDGTIHSLGLPPAAVIWVAKGGSVPPGYLVPDGSAVSRSTFADLFAEIGITFGAGNGSTTFNLPDIRGRVIAAEDSGAGRLTTSFFGATASIAAVGGLESNNVILIHNHAITDPGHTHVVNPLNPSVLSGPGPNTFGAGSQQPTTFTISSNTTGITINNAGSASAHNIVQPTIILRALIKT